MDSRSLAARRAAERWFLDRGLPSVVTRRARIRGFWPRSAPVLAAFATVSLCLIVVYLVTGEREVDIAGAPTTVETIALVILGATLPFAAVIGWLVARRMTDRAMSVVSGISVAILLLHSSSEYILRTDSRSELLLSLPVPVVVVAGTLALTAAGIGSVLGWAVQLTLSQIAVTGILLVRALPVVLLTALMFFNTYAWLMVTMISATRFWLALFFLMALAGAFVISGTLDRAQPVLRTTTAASDHERLAGTPFEKMSGPRSVDALTRGERFNVVFVLAASQLAQILSVAAVTAAIFFVLGSIVLTPRLLAEWTRGASAADASILGMTLPVSQALVHMSLFLGALTFMYVSARSVGDGEYRSEFLDPLIDDLELTLLARHRYRHTSASDHEHGGDG